MFPTFSYQYCAWGLSTHCCTYAESMQGSHNRTLQLQLWLVLGFIWKQHHCIDCIRHSFTSHERVKCTCAAVKEGKIAEHFTRKSMSGWIRINELLNFETRDFFMIHYMGMLCQVGQASAVFSRGHLKQKYLVKCAFIWLCYWIQQEYIITVNTESPVPLQYLVHVFGKIVPFHYVSRYKNILWMAGAYRVLCKNTEAVMICWQSYHNLIRDLLTNALTNTGQDHSLSI